MSALGTQMTEGDLERVVRVIKEIELATDAPRYDHSDLQGGHRRTPVEYATHSTGQAG